MTNIVTIDSVLFEIDPMQIGTVENDLRSEYINRAEGIAELISNGISLEGSICREFESAFREDCLSSVQIKEISKEIRRINEIV